MPKRAPTPEAAVDEEYLTVTTPYPISPNWEVTEDRIDFARWIAHAMGPKDEFQYFVAFHYKPKALGMVILEISKHYTSLGNVLGLHKWSEFLTNPNVEENGRQSGIFFCLHKTGREAQKDGWKRVTVQQSWFTRDWNRFEKFKPEYPITLWCEVPVEDPTNKRMCRPLPEKIKPRPKKPTPPVVGSSAWLAGRPSATPTAQAARGAPVNARGRGRGVVPSQPNSRSNAQKPPSTSSAWPTLSTPSSTKGVNPTPVNVWKTARANSQAINRSQSSTSSTFVPPRQVISPTTSSPAASPWATNAPTSPQSYPFAPPGLIRKSNTTDSTKSSGNSSSDDSSALASPMDHYDAPIVSITDAISDVTVDDPDEYAGGTYIPAPWERGSAPNAESSLNNTASAAPSVNLWADIEKEEEEKAKNQSLICITHNKACNKGICRQYAKQLQEEEKKKTQAETEPSKKGGKRKKAKKATATDAAVDDDGFATVGGKKAAAAEHNVTSPATSAETERKAWGDDDYDHEVVTARPPPSNGAEDPWASDDEEWQ